MLWLWAVDNAPDGNLSELYSEEISMVAGWDKDSEEFVNALIKSGFLNEDKALHDWYEYAGKLIERRIDQEEYTAKKVKLYSDLRLIKAVRSRDGSTCQYCGKIVNWLDRKGKDGGTYDLLEPGNDYVKNNVVVCCRECSSLKNGLSLKASGMTLIPNCRLMQINADTDRFNADLMQIPNIENLQLHYRTLPYPTVPNQINSGGGGEDFENHNEPVENYGDDEISTAYLQKWGKPAFPEVIQKTREMMMSIHTAAKEDTDTITADDMELLNISLDIAVNADNFTLKYLYGIYKKYRERGIKDTESYYDYEIERTEGKRKAK